MRGGFVACLGDHRGLLELAAERLRWHRGHAVCHRHGGLEVAALCDPHDGPSVESEPGALRLVHGAAADSLANLQARAARFAALHWDGSVLRASRDPMGLAPLFYRVTDGAVWFATEIHALLGVAPNAPHLEALGARAAFAPLDEETGWVGIRRVLPGCTMEVDRNLRTRSRRYWDPSQRFGTYRGSRRDAVGELLERFRRAVERSYEPGSGVVLSGGQDSAAVAMSVPSAKGKPHLVHAHFPGLPRTHEASYAQAVANALGVPLHTVSGEVRAWDIEGELDMHGVPYTWLPFGIDEPVHAHLRASGIGIALDGHDGDGVLGPQGGAWGELLLKGQFGRLAALCREHGFDRAARGLLSDLVPPALRPRRFAPRQSYLQSVATYFSGDLRARIHGEDIDRWTWPSKRWKTRQIRPLLARAAISFEQKEIEAARHGIDLRHPFADRDLVDFMISLPCGAKADPVRTKALMLEALGDDLPASIRDRPKSDYMEVIRHRVDPARCLDTIRSSNVRFPDVDYRRLFEHGDAAPDRIPLFLLVNLARAHVFARQAL
jgi:asparagine synthase (glutamine-hydrolysing)